MSSILSANNDSSPANNDDSDDDDDDGIPSFLKKGGTTVVIVEDDVDSSGDCDGRGGGGGGGVVMSEEDEAVLARSALASMDLFFLAKDREGLEDLVDNKHFSGLEKGLVCMATLGRLSRRVLEGSHTKALNEDYLQSLKLPRLLAIFRSSPNAVDDVRSACFDFIVNKSKKSSAAAAATERTSRDNLVAEIHASIVVALGVAYFELFIQMNFTGPELPTGDVNMLTDSGELDKIGLALLECDGEFSFPHVQLPICLVIARTLLSIVANPAIEPWHKGVSLDGQGRPVRMRYVHRGGGQGGQGDAESLKSCCLVCSSVASRGLWSARAAVIQARCIQQNHYGKLPTVWTELIELNADSDVIFSENVSESSGPFHQSSYYMGVIYGPETANYIYRDTIKILSAQFYLEWGLAMHHLQFGDKGKNLFLKAQDTCGLHTELTGALGKRTKFQKVGYAQLYLIARSSIYTDKSNDDEDLSSNQKSFVDKYGIERPVEVVPDGSFTAGKSFEGKRGGFYFGKGPKGLGYYIDDDINKQNVSAASNNTTNSSRSSSSSSSSSSSNNNNDNSSSSSSRDIPVFDVPLATSIAAAKAESIAKVESEGGWIPAVFELGRRLVKDDGQGNEVAIREVRLDDVEGGSVENILFEEKVKWDYEIDKGGKLHPVDQAIILARCLDISNDSPQDGLTTEQMHPYIERVLEIAENWMIHSTALLERSWLEYEKRKTFDRALLQIQALLDQHTTKLTMFQSTYDSIESSAPVQDRIKFIHCIVYPAQFELKRDLALRYMRGSVFVSALNLFKEIEMWDEVVQCYQFLDKPQRAELGKKKKK